MSFHWKSFIIGVLSLIGIPLASFALTPPKGSAVSTGYGIVYTVHVGLVNGLGNGIYVTLVDESGTESVAKNLTDNQAGSTYLPSILSLLMFSKAAGNYVTLWNHTSSDANQFDEVVVEKQ